MKPVLSVNSFMVLTVPDPKFDIDIRIHPLGEPDPESGKVLHNVSVLVSEKELEPNS